MYCHLLEQIDPERIANTHVLRDDDRTRRAAYVVSQGKRLGAEFTVQPVDIVRGNEKLNLAFVAALFNACPGLDPPDETQLELFAELPDDDGGDCREERAFRMWINSLGIETCAHATWPVHVDTPRGQCMWTRHVASACGHATVHLGMRSHLLLTRQVRQQSVRRRTRRHRTAPDNGPRVTRLGRVGPRQQVGDDGIQADREPELRS